MTLFLVLIFVHEAPKDEPLEFEKLTGISILNKNPTNIPKRTLFDAVSKHYFLV